MHTIVLKKRIMSFTDSIIATYTLMYTLLYTRTNNFKSALGKKSTKNSIYIECSRQRTTTMY